MLVKIYFTGSICKSESSIQPFASISYSIKGFSQADNTIILTNPHRAGLDISIPISELGPFNSFSVTRI